MWNRSYVKGILLKGYRDMRLRAAAAGVLACTWWAVLYPELCFTPDTYERVIMTDEEETVPEKEAAVISGMDGQTILDATEDQIVIKSRLLEWLEEKAGRPES